MKEEVWIETRFSGYYVSNMGRVKSATKILKPFPNSKRYMSVTIKEQTLTVHRLVATAFIPNPDNKPTVNHKNRDRSDNTVDNLEWATYKEQIHHLIGLGLTSRWSNPIRNEKIRQKALGREGKPKALYQFDMNGNLIKVYERVKHAVKETGAYATCISRCCLGKAPSHKGFKWSYSPTLYPPQP